MQGLATVNVGSLADLPAKNVLDVRQSMTLDQVQLLAKALHKSNAAVKNAELLNRQLRQKGMLGPDQTVMGFANGNVFSGAASYLRNDNTTSGETPRKRED